MIEKTYKIPEGSEEMVDHMVSVAIERFYRQRMSTPPVEERPEYQEAVDSFRIENGMTAKFVKLEEKIDDIDTSINNISVL